MAQLTADTSRKYKLNPDIRGEIGVAASTTIFMNSAVGRNAGLGRPLNANDPFAGFAVGKANNSTGAAGAITVELRTEGITETAFIAGATAITEVGTAVYMSDGNTFTTMATSNSKVGTIAWFLNGLFGINFKADTAKVS